MNLWYLFKIWIRILSVTRDSLPLGLEGGEESVRAEAQRLGVAVAAISHGGLLWYGVCVQVEGG